MKTDKSIERLYRKAQTFSEVDAICEANAEQEDHIDEWKVIRYAVKRTEQLIEAGLTPTPTTLPENNRYRHCANIAQMLDVDDDYQLIDRWGEMVGVSLTTASTNTRRIADRMARTEELRAAGIIS